MTRLQILTFVAILVKLEVANSLCPHSVPGLVKWSNAATWGGTKPQEGQQVTLTTGMHVLLDESTPSLGSITVESGAKLVWADSDGITLTVSYLLIHGEFHLGSDDCRFDKKANIVLTGLSNSTLNVSGFGRKFIGVAPGGTLELHGREKKSWTKLAASIPAAADTCGVVYDHKDTPHSGEWGRGIHVIVWNMNGTMFDFGVFFTGETWDTGSEVKLVDFLEDIPDGKVVALGVHRNLGGELKPEREWESLYTAVETVGGLAPSTSQIRQVKDFEAYAFITIKGSPDKTMEQHVHRGLNDEHTITDDVHITLWNKKLKFSVESAVRIGNNYQYLHDIDFRVVSTDIAYPKINVIDDVSSWMSGDRVVFTSTDFDWKQAEEFEIAECSDCDRNQFRVKGEFRYPHYGKVYDGVDMRGEVALLSRGIVIEGQMEDKCYATAANKEKEDWLCTLFDFDHFGGHLKVTKGFKSAHIQGVELYHMGQQAFVGSYPIHWHMCDDASGSWARNNSIHHSLARCVTIHGTDGVEVSDNVCFDHLGHGYFLEDSVEQYNILDGNIGIGTKHGTHIFSDMHRDWCDKTLKHNCNALSTFWITHFNNYVRNNVAAGSDNVGFWMIYSDVPLGPSATRQAEKLANNESAVANFTSRYTPILEFDNNVAHSNVRRGLSVDNRISHGFYYDRDRKYLPENTVYSSNKYDPREPNNEEGKQVTTSIDRLTVYKNKGENIWLRGGNIVLANCSIADSQRGLTMAKSARNTFTEIRNSVFIGMSDNKGVGAVYVNSRYPGSVKPRHHFDRSMMSWNPNDPVQGFIFYDGPNFLTNCYFNNYYHWHWNQTWDDAFGIPGYNTGGAISWRRGSMLFFDPHSTLSGVKFGFCDDTEGNWAFDGNKTVPGFERDADSKLQATLYDVDGSVTGFSNTQVVKNLPFFTTPRCDFRKNWGMSVCPNRYAKTLVFSDVQKVSDSRPIFFIRDDAHNDPFSMAVRDGRGYHFMLNKTYTVHFNKTVPTYFKMQAYNMHKGDFLRFGVCMPKDMTSFELYSWYPYYKTNSRKPPVEVDTIEKLDADKSGVAFFWDKEVGMLFVKLMSNETTFNRDPCPNGRCPNFQIKRKDGSDTADCLTSAYGPYVKKPEGENTQLSRPACTTTPSEGYGAGETRPTTVPMTTVFYELNCPAPNTPAPEPTISQSRGCSVDTSRRDMAGPSLYLRVSMTRGFCVRRCAQHGYRFAALQNVNYCMCGNSFGSYGTGSGCTKPCIGNPDSGTTCGGAWRNEVFSTGIVGQTTMKSCGPGSHGFMMGEFCYYLGDEPRTYIDAQQRCLKMGGDLATIPSAETHANIKGYLGDGNNHVWIGLTDSVNEGQFVFMDGTPATYINGELKDEGENTHYDFVAMDANRGYEWDQRKWYREYRYLCQLPIDSSTTAVESCGSNSEGRRIGKNGKCYLVINTPTDHATAEYQCLTRHGVMAIVDDEASQREIRNHLLMFGIKMDYWTGDKATEADAYTELDPYTLFNKATTSGSDENGIICQLDSSSPAVTTCPTHWQSHGGSCYLYTGRTVSAFDSASALCKSGSSSMLTVHSQTENNFVYNMVKTFHDGVGKDVLLGYKYRSIFDSFVWTDGSSPNYENWADDQGMAGLTDGHCSKIRVHGNNIVWRNSRCVGQEYAVVCKFTP